MAGEKNYVFPVPTITDEDRPFWEGVQQGKFLIQKCLVCGALQWFPRPVCVRCFSMDLGWQQASGKGIVHSFTVITMSPYPTVKNYLEAGGEPIIFAKIDLDEGVRIASEIIESGPRQIQLGARVEVVFSEAKGTSFNLAKFRLVSPSG